MRLNVNPTRMELLRLRKRIVYARKGHDLLEDKLQEMMRRFLDFIKVTGQLDNQLKAHLKKSFKSFIIAQALTKKDILHKALEKTKLKVDIETGEQQFMNLKLPLIKVNMQELKYRYGLVALPLELDVALKEFVEALPQIIKLAQMIKSCQILAWEIQRTRRRVNALEFILIPSIAETIHYIKDKLTELERANIMRLMRIKELIRRH